MALKIHRAKRRKVSSCGVHVAKSEAEHLEQERKSKLCLRGTFAAIIAKYDHDFTGIGDEIDQATGKVVVDNGHIKSMRHVFDVGNRKGRSPAIKMVWQRKDDDDSEDELSSPVGACRVHKSPASVARPDVTTPTFPPESGGAKVSALLTSMVQKLQTSVAISQESLSDMGQQLMLVASSIPPATQNDRELGPTSITKDDASMIFPMTSIQQSPSDAHVVHEAFIRERDKDGVAFSDNLWLLEDDSKDDLRPNSHRSCRGLPKSRTRGRKETSIEVRRGWSRVVYSTAEDELLLRLRDVRRLPWEEIVTHFTGRVQSGLMNRYELLSRSTTSKNIEILEKEVSLPNNRATPRTSARHRPQTTRHSTFLLDSTKSSLTLSAEESLSKNATLEIDGRRTRSGQVHDIAAHDKCSLGACTVTAACPLSKIPVRRPACPVSKRPACQPACSLPQTLSNQSETRTVQPREPIISSSISVRQTQDFVNAEMNESSLLTENECVPRKPISRRSGQIIWTRNTRRKKRNEKALSPDIVSTQASPSRKATNAERRRSRAKGPDPVDCSSTTSQTTPNMVGASVPQLEFTLPICGGKIDVEEELDSEDELA